jgi:ABC-type sugar transport system substrate-binding protein
MTTNEDLARRWEEAKSADDIAAVIAVGEEMAAALSPKPDPAPEPEESGIRYPDIDVTLVGVDSHPFAIIKAVTDGLRKGGIGQAERDAFREEALSGDYDHIIQTAMRWVNVS